MSSSSTSGTLVDVTMPQMGVSVAEGTIVEWKKAVAVSQGRKPAFSTGSQAQNPPQPSSS